MLEALLIDLHIHAIDKINQSKIVAHTSSLSQRLEHELPLSILLSREHELNIHEQAVNVIIHAKQYNIGISIH
jgi:hypothetical protein